ncbi:IPT/TIG domain-containing protein [Nocardia gipuzkoensis]|uniref:IPT/TIG domain-containing protein n=1 Tax=Nocardia gipuzkoensis TaxID=2749991 RepID=UPI0015EF9239|nr:IPT/TIG domain-containing protein [Nocardia gipuzkoensis]
MERHRAHSRACAPHPKTSRAGSPVPLASRCQSVTITGTGFTGPLTVNFGCTATTFTIDSATQITAVAPGGSGAVQVTVTGSGGTSNGLTYTYV